MNTKKRYLIVVSFGVEEPPRKRAAESVPPTERVIKQFSDNECQLAFHAQDGSAFGYLFKTARPIRELHRTLFGEIGLDTSPLLTGDSALIVECGEDFDGRGLSRAWTWLQHH